MLPRRSKKTKNVRIVTPKNAVEEKPILRHPALYVKSSSSLISAEDDLSIKHRIASVMWDKTFDPFQLFEIYRVTEEWVATKPTHMFCKKEKQDHITLQVKVTHRKCHIVHVHVVSGKDISRGWFSQVPDPYLVLWTPGSPNGRRRTRAITGTVKPVWNERFEFLLDAEDLGTLEVMLMDANRMMDRIVGRASLKLNGLPMDRKYSKDLYFDNGSRVLLRLLRKEDTETDLRFSLALSEDEKAFLLRRRNIVYDGLKKLLGGRGPRSLHEVPCVAIIGSGGGFRATTGSSGAFKALEETGVLDCCMFTAALSGSSWVYLDTGDPISKFKGSSTSAQIQNSCWGITFLGLMMLWSRKSLPMTPGKTECIAMNTELHASICTSTLGMAATTRFSALSLTVPAITVSEGIRMAFATILAISFTVEYVMPLKARYLTTLPHASRYQGFLYCQPDFPHHGPSYFQSEIRNRVCTGWVHLLTIGGMFNYMSLVTEKSRKGQPVSFTDFFGHLVGDTLLGDLSTTKLSEQRRTLVDGLAPLPLYSCLSVKKDVSARVYQDWVEFSPYEVGMAKYGTFVTPELFGSKFYLGRRLRHFDEFPIHFLFGIWGSAFCILFKRLLNEESGPRKSLGTAKDDEQAKKALDKFLPGQESLPNPNNDTGTSEEDLPKRNSESEDDEDAKERMEFLNKAEMMLRNKKNLEENIHCKSELGIREYWKERRRSVRDDKNDKQRTFWYRALEGVFTSSFMDTRTGRAALIYNPLRGLDLQNTFPFSPFSPTTREDTEDFQGLFEPVAADVKRMYLVDAGLGFNLPFPLLLRPQRAVDVYLAFDYSGRDADDAPPFGELLLAEQWAVLNNVPFPPVERQSQRYLKEPVRECYVFQDADDPYCPIIIFFPLVNARFRRYKSPGVRRHTPEEMEFANFSLFSDDTGAYAMYNFQYTPLQFNRLAGLVEFNLLDNLGTVKSVLSSAVVRKRRLLPKISEEGLDVGYNRNFFVDTSIATLERYASFLNKQRSGIYSSGHYMEANEEESKELYYGSNDPENVVEKPRKFLWARRRSSPRRGSSHRRESSPLTRSSTFKHGSGSSASSLQSESSEREKPLTGPRISHPSRRKVKVKNAKELEHSSANIKLQTSSKSLDKTSIPKREGRSSTGVRRTPRSSQSNSRELSLQGTSSAGGSNK